MERLSMLASIHEFTRLVGASLHGTCTKSLIISIQNSYHYGNSYLDLHQLTPLCHVWLLDEVVSCLSYLASKSFFPSGKKS